MTTILIFSNTMAIDRFVAFFPEHGVYRCSFYLVTDKDLTELELSKLKEKAHIFSLGVITGKNIIRENRL